MLAILYLAAMIYFGDRISRLFCRFVSAQHRVATSFLVGLLLSTWITYLGSLAFARLSQPLVMGNIIFLLVFVLVVYKLPRRSSSPYLNQTETRAVGSDRWDWICLGAFAFFTCWLMLATLSFKNGEFLIGFRGWADYGANLSVAQSFVFGHNFPPEHPFFPGEIIRYHFLFWFQAGNLEFLGLNLVWAVNLLSIFSMLALFVLIMTFAEVLFSSRVVARIAAGLFFFSTSLSYWPFLRTQKSFNGALTAISRATQFLPSGWPARGDDWGVLSVYVFANQRHFISGIGIFFVVMTFLIDHLQRTRREAKAWLDDSVPINEAVPATETPIASEAAPSSEDAPSPGADAALEPAPSIEAVQATEADAAIEPAPSIEAVQATGADAALERAPSIEAVRATGADASIEAASSTDAPPSSATAPSDETAAAAEASVSTEAATDDAVPIEAAPSVDATQPSRVPLPPMLRPDLKGFIFFGALIGLLPYWNSAVFVSAIIVVGCVFLLFPSRLYSALLLIAAALIGLPQVFLLKAGSLVPSNQSLVHWGYTLAQPTLGLVIKYLGWTFGFKWLLILIALVFLSGFHRRLFLAFTSLLVVAFMFQLSTDVFNNHKLLNIWAIFGSIYAAYALWRIAKEHVLGAALAVVLAVLMILSGIIDLFPVHNDPALTVSYTNDPLTTWVMTNTQPSDVFLSQTWLTHQVLFAGRKIFLGYTLFAWTAGYDVGPRDQLYRRMFQERDPATLIRLLHSNKIAYVAIDDGVRSNRALTPLNEEIFKQYFEKVWDDTGHRYANVTIYKVPAGEPCTPLQPR